MNVGLNVPDHTTLSRRNSTLKPKLQRVGKPRGRVDLVIDSTGLVIHGEGRWTRHKHGKRKRRGWRKLVRSKYYFDKLTYDINILASKGIIHMTQPHHRNRYPK